MGNNSENIEISVIMPCLNEGKTLLTCINKCKQVFDELNIKGEIIISDNGSTDNSVEIAEKAGVKVVHCKKKGYGRTLKSGFDVAQGKYFVMGDADDTYNFLEIAKFYNKIKETNADMVIGSRLKGKIEKGAMPLISRYIGTPFLTFLINLIYKTKISDSNCGLRLFKKDAYKNIKLFSTGMEFASEIIIAFQLNNLKIEEVLITLSKDAEGRDPHLNIIRDGLRNLFLILSRWVYEI